VRSLDASAAVSPPIRTLGAERAVARPAGDYARDDLDARAYVHRTLGYTLLLYALLGLAGFGAIPAAALVVAVPLVYVRLSLALHELMHVRRAAQVPFFHRLAMIFDTPLGLGYREHRAIHLAHHRHAATARDPELFQIRGNHLRAAACALIAPERHLVVWLRRRGASRSLRVEGAVRLAAFAVALALNPGVFLVYWISLRASVGGASFVFHHLLHCSGGRYGTFPLPATPAWLRVGRALFGPEPIVILTEHRLHHEWPQVRSADLPRLPGAVDALRARSRAAGRA
jgi:fatty acid desaturase